MNRTEHFTEDSFGIDRKVRPSAWCCSWEFEVAESDAVLAELVDAGAEPAGEALQPVEVEVEGDEDITAAQVVETGDEVRVIGRGAGGAERIEFAVEDPTSFGGGATGVADETRGVCGSEKPFIPAPCCKETIPGLCRDENPAERRLRGGLRAVPDKHVFVGNRLLSAEYQEPREPERSHTADRHGDHQPDGSGEQRQYGVDQVTDHADCLHEEFPIFELIGIGRRLAVL